MVIGSLCMLAITVFVVADIFSREVLSFSVVWAQKAAVYLMIWAGFLGSSMATSKGAHLRPEIGDKLWPSSLQKTYHRIRHLITGVFCIFGCVFGMLYLQESYQMGDQNPVIKMQLWIIQIVIPFTFIMSGFKNLVYVFMPDLMPSVTREPT